MQKELLFSVTKKDFDIDYFSGTGAGGQYRNKYQNCIRIRHKASGAIVTGQSNRNRKSNVKFKIWHAAMVQQYLTGKSIKQRVKEAMEDKHIKTEIKENGKWKECDL